MKTAISLPDKLFQQAEAQAKKLHISRSQLYTQALADFLARLNSQTITDQLNQLYSSACGELGSELQDAQVNLLRQVQW